MSKIKKKQCFANRESLTRINFLFQASMLMAGRNNTLASYYGQLAKKVSQKSVLRMAPDLKRWLCKKCSLPQQPCVTADLDVVAPTTATKRRRQRNGNIDQGAKIVLNCRQCGYTSSYEVNTNYQFWLENSDCIKETIKDEGNELANEDNETKNK